MAPIRKENMGNATSLFNLVRNLGGSIGIAAVSTMQTRFQQRNIAQLGSHVTPYDFAARNMMNSMQGMFRATGSDAVTASHQARAAMFGMVERQASMLAYNSIFVILAGLFVLMLPFIFLMRRPQARGGPMAMH
jgi:DHA2 family multidrug resistance protein